MVYGNWVSIFTAIAMCCFAFSTIIGWGLYGARCAEFMLGSKILLPFNIAYSLVAIVGATVDLGLVWSISETFNGFMTIPNLIGVFLLTPVVVKITNTRTEALDALGIFVSTGTGIGNGNYLTDYTIELYDEDFVRILGTHNNTDGTFTKDDTSTWSLAAGETCYVVVKTTNATDGVFVRLM
jgi:hypothetical protein